MHLGELRKVILEEGDLLALGERSPLVRFVVVTGAVGLARNTGVATEEFLEDGVVGDILANALLGVLLGGRFGCCSGVEAAGRLKE